MKNIFGLRVFFVLFISILVFNGCKEDPLSHNEEHFKAIGMLVYDASGKQIAKILRGVTADTLKGTAGLTTEHHTVKFYDESEKIVNAPNNPLSKFTFKVDDASVSTIWQHPGEEGGFEFHIKGIKTGKTHVEFFIEHEGHNDFRTGKFPLAIK
ncbi:MAG: hypothetical protein FD143_1393 [Ignavibacteria bacterium]|nr:MAG: hypothetical protein FD143_1393 [Ignavibacteria bacterium]KAF0161779.1 MAG: hypothetical protein FD188_584 [Ignavibacteria bacterium]